MNNFPENENITQEEELSTVFSNPAEHKAVAIKNGNKKRLLRVIAALLAVAILVSGTIAAIKLIPKKQDEISKPAVEDIEVLSKAYTDYKTVTVKNKNGVFKFYSEITKAQNEQSTDVAKWYMEGYEKDLVSTMSILGKVNSVTEIYASREITEKTLADCGLEKPVVSADIVTYDGGQFSILIGSKSPDNAGVYLKLSTDEKIYLVSDAIDEMLTFEALDLANTDSLAPLTLDSKYSDYTNEGKLISFDSITVSGKNLSKKVVIKPNKDDKTVEFMPYVVTEPSERVAENADKLLNLFASGVTVSGAYSFDVTPSTLNKLGLNDPDFVATIKVMDVTYTYKFKLQSDGNYAVIANDSKMVKMVAAGTFEFLNYDTTDFYATWVFIETIDKIANLTVEIGGKSYSIDVMANPNTKNDDDEFIVTYDGKNIKSNDFQTFYRFCISLACSDFTTEALNTNDEATLIYTYNDGVTAPVKVTFKKATATKYQYSLNGKPMGKINASEFNKIDVYLQQLVSGQTVTYH